MRRKRFAYFRAICVGPVPLKTREEHHLPGIEAFRFAQHQVRLQVLVELVGIRREFVDAVGEGLSELGNQRGIQFACIRLTGRRACGTTLVQAGSHRPGRSATALLRRVHDGTHRVESRQPLRDVDGSAAGLTGASLESPALSTRCTPRSSSFSRLS